MTTAPISHANTSPASQLIASELRAEMARRGFSQTWLARRMGVPQPRLSRRIGMAADVELTFADVLEMTEALGVSAERFLLPLLPRLDSNQQPSGYQHPQVSAVVDLFTRERVA